MADSAAGKGPKRSTQEIDGTQEADRSKEAMDSTDDIEGTQRGGTSSLQQAEEEGVVCFNRLLVGGVTPSFEWAPEGLNVGKVGKRAVTRCWHNPAL